MLKVPQAPSSMNHGNDALAVSGFSFPQLTSVGANWKVVGTESQVLVVSLQPGEEIICEPGSMMHTHDGIEADAEVGGCWESVQRTCIGGQELFRGKYVNKTSEPKSITLSPRYPGAKIIAVELDDSYQNSQTEGLVIKKGAWTASIGRNTVFGSRLAQSLSSGLFSGQGFLLATLRGAGTVFLNGGGTVLECQLRAGEKIILDTAALVACDGTVQIGARPAGTGWAMCCGGEGLFVAELTGPGRVIVQSMPVETAAMEYFRHMPKAAGGGGGNNSNNGGGGSSTE